jgi:hypothetical protein
LKDESKNGLSIVTVGSGGESGLFKKRGNTKKEAEAS